MNHPYSPWQYTCRSIREFIPAISNRLRSGDLDGNSLRKETKSDLMVIYSKINVAVTCRTSIGR